MQDSDLDIIEWEHAVKTSDIRLIIKIIRQTKQPKLISAVSKWTT
jgi:hypothetical protein